MFDNQKRVTNGKKMVKKISKGAHFFSTLYNPNYYTFFQWN